MIEITFSKELPTEPGCYLRREYGVVDLTTVVIENGRPKWKSGPVWMTCGSDRCGEWAGPLICNPSDDAGIRRSAKSGQRDESKGMETIYKSSDGSEHATPEDAEARDELVKAERNLFAATSEVARCFGRAAQTADGQQFDPMKHWRYWRIVSTFLSGMPRLVEIAGMPHDIAVDLDRVKACPVIRWFEQRDGGRSDYITLPINELYADKAKATEAWLVKCREYAAQVQEELAEIETLGRFADSLLPAQTRKPLDHAKIAETLGAEIAGTAKPAPFGIPPTVTPISGAAERAMAKMGLSAGQSEAERNKNTYTFGEYVGKAPPLPRQAEIEMWRNAANSADQKSVGLQMEIALLTKENHRLNAKVERLAAVLRKAEWDTSNLISSHCPCCHHYKSQGHTRNCALAAVLADSPANPPQPIPRPLVTREELARVAADAFVVTGGCIGWDNAPAREREQWTAIADAVALRLRRALEERGVMFEERATDA